MNMMKKITHLNEVYQYFDSLFEQDIDSDTLFASGYLRGFISLAATDFGDEEQLISNELIKAITDNLMRAKSELSPKDNVIVQNFWLKLQEAILIKPIN